MPEHHRRFLVVRTGCIGLISCYIGSVSLPVKSCSASSLTWLTSSARQRKHCSELRNANHAVCRLIQRTVTSTLVLPSIIGGNTSHDVRTLGCQKPGERKPRPQTHKDTQINNDPPTMSMLCIYRRRQGSKSGLAAIFQTRRTRWIATYQAAARVRCHQRAVPHVFVAASTWLPRCVLRLIAMSLLFRPRSLRHRKTKGKSHTPQHGCLAMGKGREIRR